jgi:hypothetical protein
MEIMVMCTGDEAGSALFHHQFFIAIDQHH